MRIPRWNYKVRVSIRDLIYVKENFLEQYCISEMRKGKSHTISVRKGKGDSWKPDFKIQKSKAKIQFLGLEAFRPKLKLHDTPFQL